jgi:hypothetical protein
LQIIVSNQPTLFSGTLEKPQNSSGAHSFTKQPSNALAQSNGGFSIGQIKKK